tara:strand:+ start:65 stop:220 length:156 start_codon:yes stop_codon:yes gene_type:complete
MNLEQIKTFSLAIDLLSLKYKRNLMILPLAQLVRVLDDKDARKIERLVNRK